MINPKFGSLDIEAYQNSLLGIPEVYAIGFHTTFVEKPTRLFYIDEVEQNEDSSVNLILKAIDTILTSKYDRRIWYTHNFAGYDPPFIVHALEEANQKSLDKGRDIIYTLKPT